MAINGEKHDPKYLKALSGVALEDISTTVKAWNNGMVSDHDLDIAIAATEVALTVMRACDGGWAMCTGIQTNLTSMLQARDYRKRDKKERASPQVAGVCDQPKDETQTEYQLEKGK